MAAAGTQKETLPGVCGECKSDGPCKLSLGSVTGCKNRTCGVSGFDQLWRTCAPGGREFAHERNNFEKAQCITDIVICLRDPHWKLVRT
mmetsp:Transcript_22547/g.43895  ORF Transcript_22547/g.43895 Transcript_22547/m.43895 type:complete len:89 (+) Transcript_22547:63-329(+)